MRVNFHNETNFDVKKYIKVVKKVFKKVKNKQTMELIFLSPESIKNLNNNFRNINESTDVLSFINDDETKSLGDVFINVIQAKKQALEYEHSITREISFLAVHGYLHLMGYDHETIEDEKSMILKQEEILNKAKIRRK